MAIARDQVGAGMNSGGGTSVTFTYSVQPAVGSVGIAVLAHTADPGAYTPPTGWTQIGSKQSESDIGTVWSSIWKTLDAHTNNAPNWSFANSVISCAVGSSYSGANTTTPIDQSGNAANFAGTTLTTQAVTTTQAAEMMLGLFAALDDGTSGTQTFSGPTGGFTIAKQWHTATTTDLAACISDLAVSSIQTALQTSVTSSKGCVYVAWGVSIFQAIVPVAGAYLDIDHPVTMQGRSLLVPL